MSKQPDDTYSLEDFQESWNQAMIAFKQALDNIRNSINAKVEANDEDGNDPDLTIAQLQSELAAVKKYNAELAQKYEDAKENLQATTDALNEVKYQKSLLEKKQGDNKGTTECEPSATLNDLREKCEEHGLLLSISEDVQQHMLSVITYDGYTALEIMADKCLVSKDKANTYAMEALSRINEGVKCRNPYAGR